MAASIWSQSTELAPRPPLPGTMRVDALVIGAGMAGLLTAYFLQEAGLKTVVVEASRIGSGQTKNTTAKLTSQHGLIYHELLERLGEEKARQYAEANQSAIAAYWELAKKKNIGCELVECPAYLYSATAAEALEREAEAARSLGLPAELVRETELPFPVAAALRFSGQARFHPLCFLEAIAEELEIYENTPVRSVEGEMAHTERGTITAEHIIFATHFPFMNVPGYYFLRMHQERSYVLALSGAAQLKGCYLGVEEDGLSFRPAGELLLLGGGAHRTGENRKGGQYQRLRESARRYWPDCREVAAWSAQDCMTLDGLPYIGPYGLGQPHWYVATGFRKWGMTSSMVSALLLRDLILQGGSPWQEVFSPQRFRPGAAAPSLAKEVTHASRGLARRFLEGPRAAVEALPLGHGGIVEWEGEKLGVYKNQQGQVYAVEAHCPHLGCQLEWNPEEKSWDCPCHGSRFDHLGNLIDNPAQEDLDHA